MTRWWSRNTNPVSFVLKQQHMSFRRRGEILFFDVFDSASGECIESALIVGMEKA